MQTGLGFSRLGPPTLSLSISTVILVGLEPGLRVPIRIFLAVGHAALQVILNDIDGEFIGGDSVCRMALHDRSRFLIVFIDCTFRVESRLYPQRREWLHALERRVEGLRPFEGLVELFLHAPA